ncbi:hypothetical protein [Serratia marcescens]|uniref:hypothetical protein n=1 Tax=Serratia marcescens TaxID=615 RepID=UPI003FA6E82F
MDSTLLGALVGGGCAVAGAACTSVATYFSNKHAERTKIRIQKKEVLYLLLSTIRGSLHDFGRLIKVDEVDEGKLIETYDLYGESHEKAYMIMKLYFHELSKQSKEYYSLIESLQDKYVIPNIKKSQMEI